MSDLRKVFRDYKSPQIEAAVRNHYRNMRQHQTVEYVGKAKAKYLTFDKPMHIRDAMIKLNDLIDVSDPDLNLPNIQHLIQSAEAIRDADRPDWMQLVGLIHDLGKIMYLWGSDEDGTSQNEQWGLVGDIFVVGCELPDSCVFPEFNQLNPDMQDERYNTQYGMYDQNCGLDKLSLAWGHDEYLYRVLLNHPGNAIPKEGMVMIRYHSFYPWHTGSNYTHLLNEDDHQYLKWIQDFNQYDLYSKNDRQYKLEEVWDYYEPIVYKYLGNKEIMW